MQNATALMPLLISHLLLITCNSKSFFNGYAHLKYNNEELPISPPKYNYFLHGQIYEISFSLAIIYLITFISIGMCIGGCIKHLENKCNTITEYKHIQIKSLNH
eukprot:774596_1